MRHHRPIINWRLTAAFSFSLLAHAMIALAMGADVFPSSRSTSPPPTPELNTPEITPGVDNSRATTINWIGFEKPTPHQARLAQTDQPALDLGPDTPTSRESQPTSPAPVVETVAVTPSPPAAESTPTPDSADPAKTPTQTPTQAKPAAPSKTTLTSTSNAPSQKKAAHPTKPIATPTAKPTTQPAKQLVKPTPKLAAKPAAKPAPPQPASKKGGAERESPPTSQETPITVKPGQPIAMKGLRIDTVAPKFTYITRITAAPSNPLVKLTFNTAGKVTLAELIESSGYEGVDRPVKDALYNWRAHGVQLDELKKKDPKQVFSLQFRIVLQ
jgi:hypothetical protein